MAKWICGECGYIYDEEKQSKPFMKLPANWICPECDAPKDKFEKRK